MQNQIQDGEIGFGDGRVTPPCRAAALAYIAHQVTNHPELQQISSRIYKTSDEALYLKSSDISRITKERFWTALSDKTIRKFQRVAKRKSVLPCVVLVAPVNRSADVAPSAADIWKLPIDVVCKILDAGRRRKDGAVLARIWLRNGRYMLADDRAEFQHDISAYYKQVPIPQYITELVVAGGGMWRVANKSSAHQKTEQGSASIAMDGKLPRFNVNLQIGKLIVSGTIDVSYA